MAARTPVQVLTLGRVDADAARSACWDSGLAVALPGGTAPAFSLVLCEDYLAPELRWIDARHRASGTPWLLAKPCGAEPWVGPFFGPGRPCWSCLAQRLRGHRRSELLVQEALRSDGPVRRPVASLAAGRALGLQLAVLETAKWLAGVRYEDQDAVCTIDTLDLRTLHHPVARRPQCPECGDPGLAAERVLRPFIPAPRPKASQSGGSHRALRPEQMLSRHGHLVGPVTGIISEVRPDPRAPEGVNAYVSGHNLALGGHTLAGLRSGLRSRSGGKGLTPLEAEVGALCEAAERYCGTRQGDEPVIHDTLSGLGERAIHPNDCQLFDDRQFRDRHRWNAGHSAFQQVCPPLGTGQPTDWTPVWSVTAGAHRLLPTSLLYFAPDPDSMPVDVPWADSNGNAAGSSLEDAAVQGFLELVERDAVALWWYNRTRQPMVDLDAFDEPWLAALRDTYARMRRELWVLDLTCDLGIPAMAAISRRTDKPAEDIAFGFGAHFDPRLALRRAVTEMGQLLPAVAGARPDGSGYGVSDPELLSWWCGATTANQPYLLADPGQSARTPSSYHYVPRADLAEDIAAMNEIVESHDMELLVLDQTRIDVELPVVKVIVPGLRHFWARLGPGRLFDVPVRLGRLSRPTAYERLNPIPLFV